MVAIGALVLLASMSRSRGLYRFVPRGLQRKWSVLFVLICSFFFGYCGYLVIQSAKINFPLEILISTIFLGGALFVFGIVSLTSHTLRQLKLLNEELETKVLDRTEALSKANQSLMESQAELAGHARFLGSVINALSHPFYVIDAESYEVILANSAAGFDLTGATRSCHWLTHGNKEPCGSGGCPCAIAEIKAKKRPVVLEHLHLNAQGEERFFEVHGYPIFDQSGKLLQIIEYSIDITEKKLIEKDLVKARHLAEAANAAKSEFLANVSHEIRTPMNAIMGMAYLALQTELDQQQRDYIGKVYYSSEHLLEIIGDILDLAKIEAGQMQLSWAPFRLQALLSGIMATMENHAAQKGLALVLDLADGLPGTVRGDDLRLRQILLNLVSNAIKFTRAGTVTITIAADRMPETESMVELHCAVADTGMGIAPEKIDRIFKSFEQADNSHTREYGGTGLGLAICKQLAGLMGGRIWVESTVGQGSCFHVAVPLQCLDEADEAAGFSGTMPASRKQACHALRLLLVDDNELNREVARLMLIPHHQIITARHGKEALELLAEHDIDVILMDVQMPVMDGLTATTLIRDMERGARGQEMLPVPLREKLVQKLRNGHLPIVAMTAHALDEDRRRCLLAGMDRYISKPFQYTSLCEVLDSLVLGEPSGPAANAQPVEAGEQVPLPAQVFANLKAATNLPEAQLRVLVTTAQETITKLLVQAEAAVQQGDLAALAAVTHSLKGTLLQCGLDALADQAENLSLHARKDGEADFATLVRIFRHGLGDLIVQLPPAS